MSGPTLNYGNDEDRRKPLLVLARKAAKMTRVPLGQIPTAYLTGKVRVNLARPTG